MVHIKSGNSQTVRRTPCGALDTDYYYRIGKQRHDRELDEAVSNELGRIVRMFRRLFHAGEIGTTL